MTTYTYINQLQGASFANLQSRDFAIAVVDADNSRLTRAQLSQFHSEDRAVFAYASVGEAESFRDYWQDNNWSTNPPDFLLGANPDFAGAYRVKFWDADWQQVVIDRITGLAQQGYKGVLLDVVDAYKISQVISNYDGISGNIRLDMQRFIEKISAEAKAINPEFQIIANGGIGLLNNFEPMFGAASPNTSYLEAIDGVNKESTWTIFDTPNPALQNELNYLAIAKNAGKFILAIDYASQDTLQAEFITKALAQGFIPFAGNIALDNNIDAANLAVAQTISPALVEQVLQTDTLNQTRVSNENPQVIITSAGNDRLFGNGGADTLFGAAGKDTLDGGNGNDMLFGGTDNDLLSAGFGNDSVSGDAGNDTVYGWYGNDLAEGGAGNDLLLGDFGHDSLYGNAGDDSLFGWTGQDYLYGGEGNDLMVGEGGDDTIDGDVGNDVMFGSDGFDSLVGGEGNDFIGGDGDADLVLGFDGNDALYGGSENDTLVGASGSDFLGGDAGDDSLDGGLGSDALYGFTGNDALYGGLDNDLLSGEEGNDNLYGNEGDDSLYGGAGIDRFHYTRGDDIDTLYDFNAAEDKIVLHGFTGTANAVIAQYATQEIGRVVFTFDFGEQLIVLGANAESLNANNLLLA